jgi:uncharacterized membrane protein YhhN
VLILLVWVWGSLKGPEQKLLALALLFSAGGDVALTFVRGVNQNFFILGLGLFLTAHIFYSILFGRRIKINYKLLPIILGLLGFSITMGAKLYPNLGDMTIPVFAYILVITVMGSLSVLHEGADWMLISGTLIFISSDSCIAVNKFLQPFEGAGFAIMVTYYLAQYLISKSFLLRANNR